jgi:Mrp family chromosome partitioning ATPase/capsular polysaccharide biosynthesis protein
MPMTGYLGMDLPRLVALLRARRQLIAAIVLGAVVLAAIVSLAQPDKYRASADLLFGRTTNADAIIAGGTTDTGEIPERAAATNLALASLDTVAVRVARQFPGVTAGELKNSVSIEAAGESDVVTVTAERSSARDAAGVANAFAAEIAAFRRDTARADIQRAIDALDATLPADQTGAASDSAREVRARLSQLEALKALQTGNVHVVEAATPPDHRSSPRPLRNMLIAALVALILAAVVVVLLARFDDRIRDEDELTALMGASVLTRVPRVGRRDELTPTSHGPHEPALIEAFEFLRLNLELTGVDRDGAVIAVTSPAAADGKTTVTAWLARALALSGAEVVAVDLDLRKPNLHSYFEVSPQSRSSVLEALLESVYDENGNAEAGARPAYGDEQDRASGELRGEERSGPGRRVHSDEDIAVGLEELARCHGHARRASRALSAAGRNIPESTLRRWKDVHAALYAEIRATRTRGTVVAEHLRVLAGSNHSPLPGGLVGRGRLKQLFDNLRQGTDYVLVDTVPVSTVADASAVVAAADGVLVVVDLDQARRRDLVAAKEQLGHARARILGIVINRAEADLSAYYAPENHRKPERAPTGG